jgi:hypothetical protein
MPPIAELAPSVLIVTWDGGGNVSPALGLAARLESGGSQVAVLGQPPQASRVEAEGLTFLARQASDPWDGPTMAAEVATACRDRSADLAVVDYMLPAALCGAEAADVGRVVLVHTLYRALLADGVPGPMMMSGSVDSLNDTRRTLGLPRLAALGDLLASASGVLVTCPSELDALGGEVPGNLRYVDPMLEDPGPDLGWEPPPGDDPLVVVSLGTTPMGEMPVIARILDALATIPTRVVVTLGDHLDPAGLVTPTNARTVGYTRHAAVMPHASLVVTHAGLGTVLAALAHGVALLCLPLGREQPDNARAVVEWGAGLSLPPDAGEAEIRESATRVLDDPGYTRRAVAMQAIIAASPDPVEVLAAMLGPVPPASAPG